jgi:thymidylate kinase
MDRSHDRTPRLLAEVTGVAGSGKTAVSRLVCEGRAGFRRAEFIHTRIPSHLGHLVHAAPRLLPMLAAGAGAGPDGPRPSWPDVKLMAYVTEWERFLRRRPVYGSGVTLFDQGPIYALVRLRAQGSNVTGTPAFERWWSEMIERWARELDAVIWLDAPDDVLRSRIDGRDQRHTTKGAPAEETRRFLTRYRSLFEETLDRIDVPDGPMIVRVDTGAARAEEVAEAIGPMLSSGAALAAETGGDRGDRR